MDGKAEFDIVLNFRGVTYLNSSNTLLLKLRRKVQSQRRRIVLSGDRHQRLGSFRHRPDRFDFTDSVATGLASLQLSPDRPLTKRSPGNPSPRSD